MIFVKELVWCMLSNERRQLYYESCSEWQKCVIDFVSHAANIVAAITLAVVIAKVFL